LGNKTQLTKLKKLNSGCHWYKPALIMFTTSLQHAHDPLLLSSFANSVNFFQLKRVSYLRMQPQMEPTLDLTLIRRCQAGDNGAYAALFDNYKNLVFRTAYLCLGNPLDAEDILQEVFIQLYRSIGNYDPARGMFTTWLYRITVNRCLNIRRRRGFFSLPLEELPDNVLREPALSESQHADVDSVQHALGRLSMKLRVVIVLRYFWDLSNAEIAEILDLPLGTVKSRLNLALRALCKDLRDDFSSSTLSITEVPK
jgi:RNA polymerase sigma-70 factor, ECF subfamily